MRDFRKSDFNQDIYNRDSKGRPVTPAPKAQSQRSKWQFRSLLLLLVVLIIVVIWIGANLFSAKQTLQQHAQKLGQPVKVSAATANNPTQTVAADFGQPMATTEAGDKVTQTVLSHVASSNKAQAETASGKVVSSSLQSTTTKPAAKPVKPAKPSKPVFDFYKVLPKQNTAAPSVQTQQGAAEPKQYMLQVASYQDRQAAEQMRAHLLLLGLSPKVIQTGDDNNIWYRVDIGPFNSMPAADAIRQKLQQNGINGSMVRQIIKEQGYFDE